MGWFILILVVVILIIVGAIGLYNGLIRSIEAVRNNAKQIDIQLDRRYKVFESLINVVKKYMDYEQTTLKDVVRLRNEAEAAKTQGNDTARIAAENEISKIANGLSVTFEQYPDLKANQNVLQLQEEIVNTENKLAFSKQAYNDSIEQYNASKKSFPQSLLVRWFSIKLDVMFAYWSLTAEQVQQQENYTVKL